MATVQVSASVQNDGNFAHLDQFDPVKGLLKRIEVFRCSQPSGPFGITGAGSPATAICGADHLTKISNRVHRSIYSEGQRSARISALLEIREEMNPHSLPEGSWDVRIRDVDARSPVFGHLMRALIVPQKSESGVYEITYEVRGRKSKPTLIVSPLEKPLTELASDLPDLGVEPSELPPLVKPVTPKPIKFMVTPEATRKQLDEVFSPFYKLQKHQDFHFWFQNIEALLQFGDLGPKSVHPGMNLSGENPHLVSDYIVWRKYRLAMVLLGRFVSDEMSKAVLPMKGPLRPLENNAKPGVYSIYVLAYKLNISLYQLVLDKVYSDYGGIPMEKSPGSRLETGRSPVIDATKAIRAAADLAHAFFLSE